MMAKSTRFFTSQEPLSIFQDNMFENPGPISHAPMPAAAKPRRPLQDASSNVVLNPPATTRSKQSPQKARNSSPLSALKPSQGNKLHSIIMAPPSSKSQNTDCLRKKPFLSKFKTVAQRPTIDANLSYGKENIHPTIFPAPGPINFSIDNLYQPKANGKRALMDAAPIKDSRPMKKAKTSEDQALTIPAFDSFPPIIDDGTKPGHSYAQLIGMAILRSPHRRLTLAQIYKWISDTFTFYNANDAGWQNSIRHNLSLHKAFYKIERPKDDPGKGNYWCIEPGMESQFIKDKPTRKSTATAENVPVMSTRLEPSKPVHASARDKGLPLPYAPQAILPPLPPPQSSLSVAADVSSDATIPISDMAAPEEANDKSFDSELPLDPSLYSPLPAAMHSSPPIPRHLDVSQGTPPPIRIPVSSISRSRKRRLASMDDSGYISSLESSAMRQKPSLLTSEADRPRIKRGRAEEEIARLRASSYDSPTKGRSYNGYAPPSSSPLRQESTQMLPPLTPAVKLLPPARPPPSVSPNTNLRIHRDRVHSMLQSPLSKVSGLLDESLPWSPAFKIDEAIYGCDDTILGNADFDVFQDINDDIFSSLGSLDNSFSVKLSAKRGRLDRSQSTSALGDITNSASNKALFMASTPKAWDHTCELALDTPSRAFAGLSSPSKFYIPSPARMASPSKMPTATDGLLVDSAWPQMSFDPSDLTVEDQSEYSGLDILQGFEKIGSTSHSASQGDKPATKPGLSRFYSSIF